MLQPIDDWHYRVAATPLEGSVSWSGLSLEVSAALGPYPVIGPAEKTLGWIIGFPIDMRQAELVTGPVSLTADPATNHVQAVEELYARLGGRFVLIIEGPDGPRLYLDCTGQIPCVFDADACIAGTSSSAILSPDTYTGRFDEPLYKALHIAQAGWAVAGLTMHQGVERLMPNHYLDLRTWTQQRHWPGPSGMPIDDDPEAAIAEFIGIIQTHYRAIIAGPRRLAIGLTAGQDTRMLLACARNFVDQIDFVTVTAGNAYNLDRTMARRIAEGEGLSHKELPLERADTAARERYLWRNGHCVADANANDFPSVHGIARTHDLAGGAGGAIARGFSWSPAGNRQGKPDARTVLRNLDREAPPAALAAMENWLSALPVDTPNAVMDLAYIEHRMGHWAGPQFPSDPTLVRYNPFLTRRAVDLMLGLPDTWKLEKRLSGELLRQTWPELSRYPVNTLGRWGDFRHKLARLLREPSMVRRKLARLWT